MARRSLELRGGDAAAGLPARRLFMCMEHEVCIDNSRPIGRRIKEGMHANLMRCIIWSFGWRVGLGALELGAARRQRRAGTRAQG